MTQDDKKQAAAAAAAALESLQPGWVIGVGTGSTTNRFIDRIQPFEGPDIEFITPHGAANEPKD